ncbi:MAG: site-specific DNA-methyltransferase, partial [Campylobacterales bacterium]|nr:site-specific DNA-methyltransferase [Campylobacterales bacterium]
GWLIKSENYQALNTILPKFKEKVQTIYIDPPFNLDSSDQFLYRTNYKDANWATLLENRLKLAKKWLNEKGSIFVRCDYNGNWIVRPIMDSIYNGNYRNEIVLSKSAKLTEKINKYHSAHDSLLFYTKSDDYDFEPATKKRDEPKWRGMHLPGIRWSPIPVEFVKLFKKENIKEKNGKFVTRARIILGKELLPPEGRHWALSQESIFELEKEGKIKLSEKGEPLTEETETQKLTDNWTDWVGYSSIWGFTTENNEKVLERVIKTSSFKIDDYIMDFFLGSGTTTATAHKLGRKWIGVEMGEHFYTVVLPRMKKVLAYDKSGISKEVKEYQGGGFFKYYELEQYE